MPTKKIVWVADSLRTKNKHEFSSKKAALAFEKTEAIAKEIEDGLPILGKYFKTQFSKDPWTWSTPCITFCVDCGKLVSQYEEEQDGHDRTYPGKELYSEPNRLFLDGFRCLKCHNKVMKLYEEMVQYYFKDNKKVILMSFDYLQNFSQLNTDHQLELIRIINCWHNRNKKNKNKDGAKTCQKMRSKT
jgi:hypothetical protein